MSGLLWARMSESEKKSRRSRPFSVREGVILVLGAIFFVEKSVTLPVIQYQVFFENNMC